MMFKKCSNFHWFILRGFNFIKTVYELFDNPSYTNKSFRQREGESFKYDDIVQKMLSQHSDSLQVKILS